MQCDIRNGHFARPDETLRDGKSFVQQILVRCNSKSLPERTIKMKFGHITCYRYFLYTWGDLCYMVF